MKQPLSKRRRVSSNPLTPLSSSDVLVASLKFSTCTSCHRTIGLKSSPAFPCTRCGASSCAICLRTCTGDPVSSPHLAGSLNPPPDLATSPLSQSNTNTSSPRRRRPRDEDTDNVTKTKDIDSGRSGCGQVVCRTCCFENPQSGAVACLDCSGKHSALQTHDSGASSHGPLNPDHSLVGSSASNMHFSSESTSLPCP